MASFFGTCFFGMASFISLIFFCITRTSLFLVDIWETYDIGDGVFIIVDGRACFWVTLSVSQHLFGGCTWILIMDAWKESQHRSQQFDKAQQEYK
jgi:hypothetical protein